MSLVGIHSFSNEEMDQMLDSLWHSGSKVKENYSAGRAGVMSLSDNKAFLILRNFLLDCEKINYKFNLFSRKDLVLKTDVSANDSIDGIARIVGKEGIVGFTLKEHASIDTESIGTVNQETLDSLFKGGQTLMFLGA